MRRSILPGRPWAGMLAGALLALVALGVWSYDDARRRDADRVAGIVARRDADRRDVADEVARRLRAGEDPDDVKRWADGRVREIGEQARRDIDGRQDGGPPATQSSTRPATAPAGAREGASQGASP